jgi:small-conductance mechanosensitive channel
MKRLKNLPALSLAVLLLACVVGVYLTRDADPVRVAPKAPASATQPSLMDQRLLQTARQMSSLAETPEERGLAAEALRLADHELDQAFATALREAATSASSLTPPLQKLAARVSQLKTRVARIKDRIAELQKSDPEAAALDVAKAQLALDQDELEDAREDLARQGGDPHASIERALQEHEAAQRIAAEPAKPVDSGSVDTLGAQFRTWIALGNRLRNATAAHQQASAKAATLERQHDGLERQVGTARPPSDAGEDAEDTEAVVARLRRLSDQTKTMRELDARIQDTQQLAAIYQRWSAEIETRRRGAVHLLLRSFAFVCTILLAAVFLNGAIRRGLQKNSERRRVHQLRFMATLAVQLAATAAILLLIFGPPTQISTIIGLATAGLTVVLKDFILAFFGWFVLMGRNGIRLGDWVEIRGVSGEVVEIGLLRTVLLEMGNWTRTGHPTGRRAAFVNSFAIEGHYFNFSTAGQWLWDEVQVSVPAGIDPYAVAEEIRRTVEHATEPDAQEAAADWERVTTQYGTRPFSARPAVDLRPSKDGLELVVRYITRAPQRYDRKSQLLQEIVGVLQKRAPRPVAQSQPAASPTV